VYVEAALAHFPKEQVHLNTAVRSLSNEPDGRVRLELDKGQSEVFDHVILATHGDQAYSIVKDSATPNERAILGQFHVSRNTAVLHSDLSLMPSSRKAWSSWNYLTLSSSSRSNTNIDRVSLTYNMNILQHISVEDFGDVLVTLNPLHEPDPSTVQGRYHYEHPLYNARAVHAQSLLPKIQNRRGISYAGAWTKYGFHEDGFSSGLKCAMDHLGAKLPFEFVDSTYSRGQKPELTLLDWLVRLWIMWIQIFVISTAGRLLGIAGVFLGRKDAKMGKSA
jgi:predicted NAD/FAD-binding protein